MYVPFRSVNSSIPWKFLSLLLVGCMSNPNFNMVEAGTVERKAVTESEIASLIQQERETPKKVEGVEAGEDAFIALLAVVGAVALLVALVAANEDDDDE